MSKFSAFGLSAAMMGARIDGIDEARRYRECTDVAEGLSPFRIDHSDCCAQAQRTS